MSKLNKILASNQKKPEKGQISYEVPTFIAGGGVKRIEKKRIKKGWLIGGVAAGCIIGFLYIPGFFMQEEINPLIVQTERANSTALRNTVLRDYPNEDFDRDGILNIDEVNVYGTDPWLADSDRDGASDLYEIRSANTDPLTGNDLLSQYQRNIDSDTGNNMETPFRNNNVLLWADNYYSKSHGGVIQTTTGYYFNEFTGYAQFSENGYAYLYENGVHTLLTYREAEDVWKIEGNCNVEIYTDKLIEYEEISLFGLKFHPKRNFLTDIVDFILPQKGFITARRMTILDLEAKSGGVYADIQRIPFDETDGFRFTRNNTSLSDLAYVRNCIDSGLCVLVSLYDPSIGEYIGIIYGYDYYGNLLIADKDNLSPVGKLYITEKAVRMINGSGEMESIGCFDFYGLGFDSQNTKISFFATAVGKINNFEYLPQVQPGGETDTGESGEVQDQNYSDMGNSQISNEENPEADNPVTEELPEELMGENVNWDNVVITNQNNTGSEASGDGSNGNTGNGESGTGNVGSGNNSNGSSNNGNSSGGTNNQSSQGQSSGSTQTGSGQSYNPNTEGQSETTTQPPITSNSTTEDIIHVLENLD